MNEPSEHHRDMARKIIDGLAAGVSHKLTKDDREAFVAGCIAEACYIACAEVDTKARNLERADCIKIARQFAEDTPLISEARIANTIADEMASL